MALAVKGSGRQQIFGVRGQSPPPKELRKFGFFGEELDQKILAVKGVGHDLCQKFAEFNFNLLFDARRLGEPYIVVFQVNMLIPTESWRI